MMNRRPKPGEDEDDLLQMQEDFLREKSKNPKIQPAAQVTNLRPSKRAIAEPESKETGTKKLSKYAQAKGLKNESKNRTTIKESGGSVLSNIVEKNIENGSEIKTPEIEDDKVYFPKPLPSILGDIIEKNTDDFEVEFNFQSCPSKGFPTVTKRDESEAISDKATRQSHEVMDIDQPTSSQNSATETLRPLLSNAKSKGSILATQDAEQIHTENIKIMNKMSEQEILEEQQKLMSTLDLKLIEFLKAKQKQVTFDTKPTLHDDQGINMDVISNDTRKNIKTVNNSLWENDVLSHPEVTKWLHFDSLEKDKLEWMKGIQESKEKTDEPYEARFDFNGYLLPYTMTYTEKNKILFHHGDEPDRPGYSLTELFELSRSAVIQQRVMALNTIAGILDYYMMGTYKDVLELPLTKIFFIIRIAMDENKPVILEPALKTMRNLIYNRIDEACIDTLLGFDNCNYQPCLENDKSEIQELESNESDLKDFHLAEIDLIAALLRTDILQRIYYILETVKPSFNCVQYCLQMLTRLARDSIETATKIVETDHLMQTIVKYFLPVTSINFMFDPQIVYNGKPVLSALKFLRVLSLQSYEIGQVLITKYNILPAINEYISSGVDGTYGLCLQIESFYIQTNLINSDILALTRETDNAFWILPVIVSALCKHVQGTDMNVATSVVSANHAAAVLQLVNKLFEVQNTDAVKHQLFPLVPEITKKWLAQISMCESYTCVHLKPVCAAILCCKTMLIFMHESSMKFVGESLKMLVASCGFIQILKHLEKSSNLLSGIETKDLHLTKNLMSLGSSVIDSQQKVLPIFNVASPIPFLKALFEILPSVEDNTLSLSYLEKVMDYLRKLDMKTPALCENWFSRSEMDLVLAIVTLSAKTSVPESNKDLIYSVTNKLCYILRNNKRHKLGNLFESIVFNKHWFSAERLINLISLSDTNEFSTISSIEDIKFCYSKYLNANSPSSELFLTVRQWRQPALPRDWIYLPILTLYSKSQETEGTKVIGEHAKKVTEAKAKEKEMITRCSLEWILFNEQCFPDLLNDISVTDRFCRIMCVFLSDNSLFLEPYIKLLLCKCVQILFKKKHELNFDKPLTGLNNFQDFYTQFLEQFQSVSYGDNTFAACVLVPLAQKHNVKWRKLLWSEYAGCLRALDCPEELLCYGLNDYLHPEESEESLIRSYMQALSGNLLRPNTMAYKIASHHVEAYRRRKECM